MNKIFLTYIGVFILIVGIMMYIDKNASDKPKKTRKRVTFADEHGRSIIDDTNLFMHIDENELREYEKKVKNII